MPKPVKWNSHREMCVAIAAGLRVRGHQIEKLGSKGKVEEGNVVYFVKSARPATDAENILWNTLMDGEGEWTA